MKQVNRKFLEEQVKKALNEELDSIAADLNPKSISAQRERSATDLGKGLFNFIVNLPYGSDESYIDFITWLKETGMYGIGSQKYYKKITDTMEDLKNPSGRVPWNHLMMRFARNSQIESDASGGLKSLDLTFKEDLAEALVNVRDKGIQRINSIPEDGKSINKVEVALIETAQELSEVADDFGFTSSDFDYVEWPWGKQVKMPRLFKNTGIADILDPVSWALEGLKDTGIYKDFAKDMIQTKDLKKEMEEFLMFHFVGLEGADFEKAYNRIRLNSDIPKVSRAVAAYNTWNEQGLKALAGIVDITLSTATTVAFMLSLMSGVATPAAPAIAAGGVVAKQAILQSLKLSLKKLPNKVSSFGVKALESKRFGTTVKALDGVLAQFSGFAAAQVISKFENILDWWRGDLVKLNEEFKENYSPKDNKSPEDRVAFYNKKIRPTFVSLAKEHSRIFKQIDAILPQDKTPSSVINLDYIKDLYKNYNLQGIYEYQLKIQKTTENLKENLSNLPGMLTMLEQMSKGNQNQIEKADKAADQIAKKEKVMDMPKAIQAEPKAAAAVQKVEPADEEIPFENILFVGDSIAVGMAVYGAGTGWKEEYSTKTGKPKRHHAKGVKTAKVGDHAQTILRKLENYFNQQSAQGIKEQTENTKPKMMIISAGTNDALGYAKNQPSKSPKQVIEILKKIVNLGKQKGYQIKLMPLMPYTGKDTYENVTLDRKRHKEFITIVNNSTVMKNHGFDSSNIQMEQDGVHPTATGYKSLLRKALGTGAIQGVSAPAIQSKKIFTAKSKPIKVFPGDVDKINAFFDRPVDEMKKIPRSQRQAAVRKYYQIVNAEGKLGIPLEVLVQQIAAESNYLHKGFLGDTKIKAGPSYGLAQILRETGMWLLGMNTEELVSHLEPASNNLDTGIIEHQSILKDLSKRKWWNKADDTQKILLRLYAYNMGPLGISRWVRRANFDIAKALSNVNAYYVKKYPKHEAGYGHKILIWANKSIPKVNFDNVEVPAPVGSAGSGFGAIVGTTRDPAQEKAQQKENLKTLINDIAKSDDYDTFRSAFYSLFDMTPTTAKLAYSDIIAARDYLSKQDLSTFTKRMIEYLRSQHKINSISWKRQYKEAVKNKDPDAEKLMAFFHRPIFFVSIFSRGLRKILGSSRVSFGFEPNNSRVSVNPDGKSVFYKQDYQGNQKFNEFLNNLDELKKVLNLVSEKVAMAYKTDPDKREQIQSIDRYVRVLTEIVNDVSDTLKDRSESAIRKAYSIAALDLAARTVK